jgi:hypothetical protein
MGQGLQAAINARLRAAEEEALKKRQQERDPNDAQAELGLAPFIRENDINFAAHSLKPEANANVFFDGAKVNLFCQRASHINVTTNTTFSQLKINEGLYGATSKAYGEILGTSRVGAENRIYLNENYVSIKVDKGTSAAVLTSDEYDAGDLVYQVATNSPFQFNVFTGLEQPNFTFLGKVKKWDFVSASTGVLVVDPILGRMVTTSEDPTQDYLWNLTDLSTDVRQVSLRYANSRFSAGETITTTTGKTFTVGASNAYVSYSSPVVGANTINLRSIVISSNNPHRDGLSTINQNSITIVSGTNMGFKANVIDVKANTTLGWTEAVLDADLPAICTSNSVYSIGEQKTSEVGALYGIFHIPAVPDLKFQTGERLLVITDTATHDANDYKMRAIAKYSAVGKLNTQENARNFVQKEQTPSSAKVADPVTQPTPKVDDRKFMAQTFFTPGSQTVQNSQEKAPTPFYVTSVDLFFKQKPTTDGELLPFTVDIVPVVNGLPNGGQKILASKTLEAPQIVVSSAPSITGGTSNTRFTFADPVKLDPNTEYAIQLRTESPDYIVWTANSGEEYTDELGNKRRVSDAPFVKDFFKGQNASQWNPILNEDLMFRLNRAVFATTGTVYLQLEPLDDKGVSVLSTNTVFDEIQLTGADQVSGPTSITYEVKTKLTDLTDQAYISVLPNEKYNFGKDASVSVASSSKRRLIEKGNTKAVNVKITMSTTDTAVTPVINHERFGLLTFTNIINNGGIQNTLITITDGGTGYTNTSACTFANVAVTITGGGGAGAAGYAVGNVSPAGGNTISHVIITNPGSGYVTTPTITIADPSVATDNTTATAVINGETDRERGNMLCRYQTRVVTLPGSLEAGDLVVNLKAIKPSGTDVEVYYKVLSQADSSPFETKNWQRMTRKVNRISPDQKTPVDLEYRHSFTTGTIQYFDGTSSMPVGGKFKYFAIKLRLTAADPSVPPYVDTLVVQAVPGG